MTAGSSSRRELLARLTELESELRALRHAVREEHATEPFGGVALDRVLCFGLAGDVYGVPLAAVREVVRYVALTRVADVHACVAGLINLRGEVLPVIDGRARFALEPLPARPGTAIVLLAQGARTAGLVVDRVLDVAAITPGSLSAPQAPLAQVRAVAAVATIAQRVVQLVDVTLLLDSTEWHELEVRMGASSVPAAKPSVEQAP